MKKELVRIHARLCRDGHAAFYKTTEKDRNRRAIVVYRNVIEENLNRFRDDMREIFEVEMYRYEEEVKVKSIPIVEELKSEFGDFSCDKWRIDSRIFEVSDSKKFEWLRAFIRDEGHYEPQYNRLRIKSMNKLGLEDVEVLVSSLGIEANITGPNCDGSYYLNVSGIDNYPMLHKIAKNKPKVK